MKKLFIGIGALGIMSFTGNQSMYSTQLIWAMDNIEDMKSWVHEDVEQGRLTEEIAESYYETLDETHGFIKDFHEKNCH